MNKAELTDWLHEQNRHWQAFLEQIEPARMVQPGVAGHWSIKDIIAHLAAWQRHTNARIAAAQRGEAEPPPPWPASLQTDDHVNAWIYDSYHERSLSDVLDESRQAVVQLIAVVEDLPDDIRIEPAYRIVQLGEQRFSASEFFDHFRDDHEPDVRAWLVAGQRPMVKGQEG